MAVAVFAAEVFVKQGIGHKFVYLGKTPVRQRKFPHLRRATVHGQHFAQEILPLVRRRFDHAAVFKLQPYAGNVIAAAVRGQIGIIHAARAAPVRRGKNFKRRNIVAAAGDKFPLFSQQNFQIHMRGFYMQFFYFHPAQPRADIGYLGHDFFPFFYGIFFI